MIHNYQNTIYILPHIAFKWHPFPTYGDCKLILAFKLISYYPSHTTTQKTDRIVYWSTSPLWAITGSRLLSPWNLWVVLRFFCVVAEIRCYRSWFRVFYFPGQTFELNICHVFTVYIIENIELLNTYCLKLQKCIWR